MPKTLFSLEVGGPKRLEVSWTGSWNELTVRMDGVEVGRVPTREELARGCEFPLPDGSLFRVQLDKNVLGLYRNGRPLPGSARDPAARLALSYGVLFFIGGFTTLLGLIGEILEVRILHELLGWLGTGEGVVFLVLGYFVRRRSGIALGLAVGLWSLDVLLKVVAVLQRGIAGIGMIGGILVGIMLLRAMWSGFGAIGELKAAESASTPGPSPTG